MKKLFSFFLIFICIIVLGKKSYSNDEYYGGKASLRHGHYEYTTITETPKEAEKLYLNKTKYAKERDFLVNESKYNKGKISFFEERGIRNSYYFVSVDGNKFTYSMTDIPENFDELRKYIKKKEVPKKKIEIKYRIYDKEFLKSEFDKNEPRALHKFGGKNNKFLLQGKIKELDSGIFDEDYIIVLEDYTSIYINKTEKQIELYFELNKGDNVFLMTNYWKLNKYLLNLKMNLRN